MSAPLNRELELLAPPRASLLLHRDSDRDLILYYRLGGSVQDIQGWSSPELVLADKLDAAAADVVTIAGSIGVDDRITIPVTTADLANLNRTGVWQLQANNGSGPVIVAYGNEVGDLKIIEGVG